MRLKSSSSGFTLIEVIVYSAVFTVTATLFLGIFSTVTRIQNREVGSIEVERQMQSVIQNLQTYVRDSSVIEMLPSATTSILRLRVLSSAKDPTLIYLSSTAIYIKEGNALPLPITNEKVSVGSLIFKKFVNDAGHDAVQVALAISYNTQNPLLQITRNAQISIARVSTVVFNSDLTPTLHNVFSLGTSTARWRDVYATRNIVVGKRLIAGTSTLSDVVRLVVSSTAALRVDNVGNLYLGGLFRLPVLATDTLGAINGALYYSSSTNKVRSYQNNSWLDLISLSPVFDPWILGGNDLYAPTSSRVGFRTASPTDTVSVSGTLHSTAGGIKFPDGITVASGRDSIVSMSNNDTELLGRGYMYDGSAFELVGTSTKNWTQFPNAPWAARYGAGAFVYDKNKMWILGGYVIGQGPKNDVWYSSDGLFWTQSTGGAGWSARYEFGGIVFDNKMWVIGGLANPLSTYKNDVWYSTDGVIWTQAIGGAPWATRASAGIVNFDNKMWVLGGFNGNARNDVWYSTDGVVWTEATSDAQWSPRYSFPVISYNNQMWLLGGIAPGPQPTYKNDVWYSTDGVMWTEAATAPWTIRSAHRAIAYKDNGIWLMGGRQCDNPPSCSNTSVVNDTWYSSDGISWSQISSGMQWSPRQYFSLIEYNNKIWVLGGYANPNANKEVWSAAHIPTSTYYWYRKQ